LVGAEPLGQLLARHWVQGRSRALRVVSSDEPDFLNAWLETAIATGELTQSAVRWLSKRLSITAEAAERRLSEAGTRDLQALWETILAGTPVEASDIAAVRVLEHIARDAGELNVSRFISAFAAVLDPVAQAVEGVLNLMGERAPLLLVCRQPEQVQPWLKGVAHQVVRLATAHPRMPLGVVAATDDWEAYCNDAAEDFNKAVLRQGVIRVVGVDRDQLRRRVAAVTEPVEENWLEQLDEEVAESVADALVDYAEAIAPGSPQGTDGARSAAERYLFHVLESRAATAGLFRLNQPAEFRFGTRNAEIDLLASTYKIAVEIDGYHHFQDLDCYRRDRRKDFLLQRHGYMVLRFLAEDILPQLGDILRIIDDAVALRRTAPKS
jgi:very-short-patch-repair endonuclease